MAFSFVVELLNMTMVKKAAKKRLVILNGPILTVKEVEKNNSPSDL